MSRDMTQKEFDKACAEMGFEPQGYLGYYKLPLPNRHLCVSVHNAGTRRRDMLAHLIRELAKAEKGVEVSNA